MSHLNAAPAGACLRRLTAVLGTTAVASLALTGVAAASAATEPTHVVGNPTCASIAGGLLESKIEPVPQGKTSKGGFAIDVSGRLFDFTAAGTPVDAVIVKGGPDALVYHFDEATAGQDLHAPVNPSNDQFYGLSHITFCYDAGGTPPPADPCEGNPAGMKADGTPCTPPPADPCETDPAGMKADGTPCTPPPADPCEGNPAGTMANGQPCTPRSLNPCETDPAGMKADGTPCTPPAQQQLGTPTTLEVNGVAAIADSPASALAAPVAGVLSAASRNRAPAGASIVRLKRCVTRKFDAVVRGQGIRRVTVFVNGRKVRTLAGGRARYAIAVDPAKVRSAVIRVSARVEFVAASGKRARTLSVTALRCQAGAVSPRFAG